MADLAIETLTAPLSEAEPCGPDLDLAGDPEFMHFLAQAESLLPTQFFSMPDGRPFDRSQFDLAGESARAVALLGRTRDLRLLLTLAKLRILDRDLRGFVDAVSTAADLLEAHWPDVHPAAEEGDFSLRGVVLQSLDDIAPVVMPLQHVPLLQHPRLGSVTYRNRLIASGELTARQNEEGPDAATIDRVGNEVDLAQVVEARDRVRTLGAALERIRNISVDQAGYDQAVRLDRLPKLVSGMLAYLDAIVVQRDPNQVASVPDAPDDATPAASGLIESTAAAAAGLAAAADYFARVEPSSPALLLVRQAEQLVGKSFVEVLRVLVPNYIEQAAIAVGRGDMFDLPLERLSDLAGTPDPDASDAPAFSAATRPEALSLLRDVEAFYARVEPSSPIPYLIERARSYTTRDFLSVLKDVLPENLLRTAPRTS